MPRKKVSVIVVTRNRKEEVVACLKSVFFQTYKPSEVIVIDNASEDGSVAVIQKKFKSVKTIKSKINTGGAGGRNLGIKKATGEFLLFMDDDAAADKNMIKELVAVMDSDRKIGIVQPKIYLKDKKNVIQGVGHGINLLTGRVYGIGVGEKDVGQYDRNIEIPMAGCTWMVKKEVFDRIGEYDEDYFIPYEDSDFSFRSTKAGYKTIYVWKARVWHRGPKKTYVDKKLEWLGITSPERAYRVSRNKIIFMRKHASPMHFLFFIFILVPLYTLIHSVIILFSKRIDILLNYWKGLFSGVRYCIK